MKRLVCILLISIVSIAIGQGVVGISGGGSPGVVGVSGSGSPGVVGVSGGGSPGVVDIAQPGGIGVIGGGRYGIRGFGSPVIGIGDESSPGVIGIGGNGVGYYGFGGYPFMQSLFSPYTFSFEQPQFTCQYVDGLCIPYIAQTYTHPFYRYTQPYNYWQPSLFRGYSTFPTGTSGVTGSTTYASYGGSTPGVVGIGGGSTPGVTGIGGGSTPGVIGVGGGSTPGVTGIGNGQAGVVGIS